MTIWEGSRGYAGKSLLLAILGYMEGLFLGARTSVLGGSLEQSKNVVHYLSKFWESPTAPLDERTSKPESRITTFRNGALIKALPASPTSARGGHPNRLRIDEADELDIAIYDAIMGQTMEEDIDALIRGEGQNVIDMQTTVASTHQHASGTMTEIKKRAAENGHPIFRWCYRESLKPHGWLSRQQLEKKKREVSAYMWRNEYDLNEPSGGDLAIDRDKVEEMFFTLEGGNSFRGEISEYIEIEEPDPRGIYATGADWAKTSDWTVITTLRVDTTPWKLVAWERTGRQPWPLMIEKLKDRLRRFPGPGHHDATGLGTVIDDYIDDSDLVRDTNGKAIIVPEQMIGKNRQELISDTIVKVEASEIIAPHIDYLIDSLKWTTNNDITGSGHMPDPFASLALAIRAGKLAAPIYWPYANERKKRQPPKREEF